MLKVWRSRQFSLVEEFAALNNSATATVTVGDTIDVTTVSLSVSPAQITEDAIS